MRPFPSWPGMRVCSSTPSGPTVSSAVPPWRVMLAAISPRISSQMPSERGAAKACSCTADSPRTAVTPTTVSASWSTSRRSSMPGMPASHSDPRSSRPSVSSTSERSNGPAARLGAVATVSSVAPASKSSTASAGVSPSTGASAAATSAVVCATPSAAGDDAGRTTTGGRRGRLGRLGRLLAGTAEDAHGSGQSFSRSGCAWSAGRPGAPNPPLAPCPVSPRWLPGSDSTSRKSGPAHLLDDELGDAVAPAHGERLGAVGVDQVDVDLARGSRRPPCPGAFSVVTPCRAASPERGCTNAA